jgi:hypothetical protein
MIQFEGKDKYLHVSKKEGKRKWEISNEGA